MIRCSLTFSGDSIFNTNFQYIVCSEHNVVLFLRVEHVKHDAVEGLKIKEEIDRKANTNFEFTHDEEKSIQSKMVDCFYVIE